MSSCYLCTGIWANLSITLQQHMGHESAARIVHAWWWCTVQCFLSAVETVQCDTNWFLVVSSRGRILGCESDKLTCWEQAFFQFPC
ncbi:hypothetical protein MPTK1_2g14570 [Marchantia polymorpha subsp. ruderalis]|uniref:Uncharacterized protein n=1 Tax=Marchantia polymorpha TaxID=3197 RepID=A0A2R6X1R0_MARPO|nr:hypothetical protein MARPO_0042s0079 [Marchantia polymorpha]BBN02348.1 hypothetical protein Mp_2g14570 [Marchantia polymorpha subsp. ruderalis]|eukprot:PTQ40043.1 hypothetical protein MARPO_0042s0079 [Marchantia polymorpha]